MLSWPAWSREARWPGAPERGLTLGRTKSLNRARMQEHQEHDNAHWSNTARCSAYNVWFVGCFQSGSWLLHRSFACMLLCELVLLSSCSPLRRPRAVLRLFPASTHQLPESSSLGPMLAAQANSRRRADVSLRDEDQRIPCPPKTLISNVIAASASLSLLSSRVFDFVFLRSNTRPFASLQANCGLLSTSFL